MRSPSLLCRKLMLFVCRTVATECDFVVPVAGAYERLFALL